MNATGSAAPPPCVENLAKRFRQGSTTIAVRLLEPCDGWWWVSVNGRETLDGLPGDRVLPGGTPIRPRRTPRITSGKQCFRIRDISGVTPLSVCLNPLQGGCMLVAVLRPPGVPARGFWNVKTLEGGREPRHKAFPLCFLVSSFA